MNETIFSREKAVLIVTRTFEAPVELVWRTWTEAELLDQWWAPKPWKSETASMNFAVGGYRLYAMVGPNGEKHWGRTDYHSIKRLEEFSGEDAFCDQEGNINPDFPVAKIHNQFSAQSGKTEVVVVTVYASEEALKQVIEMGMEEGLKMAYRNLDELLESLQG